MASPIEDMIDEIEEYVETCKPAGFSGTMIKVNRDDMQSLLEELRAKTPPEIARYQKIINNEKQILDNAKKQAENILAEAQIKTDQLVSEHEIMQQAYSQANEVVMVATKKAQELLDRATNDANDIRTGAIVYTDDLLKHLQEIMVRSMDTTRQRQDQYLNEMQQYLDMVVANRMELSPSPEETVVNSPAPQKATPRPAVQAQTKQQTKTAGTPTEKKEKATQTDKPNASTEKKEAAEKESTQDKDSGNIRNMSNKFFNKE